MVTLIIMSLGLVIGLCVLAYTLATYAVPFMLGLRSVLPPPVSPTPPDRG